MATKLVVIRDTSLISQTDLENMLSLDGQIERLKATRNRIAAGILARIAKGAQLEPGSRSYDVEEEFIGTTRRLKLIVR